MSEKDMNLDNMLHDDEEVTVTLTLDDDTELECAVVAIFPVNGRDYIALLPMQDDAEEVYLYRFNKTENDELQLDNIEDDEEFDAVSEAYDSLIDDMEFDEMMGDDEE